MHAVYLMPPILRLCKRSPNAPSRNTSEVSTRTSRTASASFFSGFHLFGPFRHTSSNNYSSFGSSERPRSRRSFVTCCSQVAPSAGPTWQCNDSRDGMGSSEKGGPRVLRSRIIHMPKRERELCISVHSDKRSDHLYRRDMIMLIAEVIWRESEFPALKDDSTDVNWDVYNIKYVSANEPSREYYNR